MKDLSIKCPHCQNEIDVEETISHQLQHQMSKDLANQKAALSKEHQFKLEEIQKTKESMESEIQMRLKQKEESMESAVRKKVLADWSGEKQQFQEQLQEQSQKIKSFQKEQLSLLKEKQSLEERTHGLELEVQKKLQLEKASIEEKIRNQEAEKHFLALKEKEDLVSSLKKEMDALQRKASQGSMQTQGEVQELAIEEILNDKYPLDHIEEVKKGSAGADIIQHVMSTMGHEIGTIAIESKRTKSFSDGWVDKLKEDMKLHKADIGILVTEVMPKDMPTFGLRNGVWVCTFQQILGLASVLRESLIQIGNAKQSQVGRKEKREMLYEFLCSNEFKFQIEGIVSAFSNLKIELDREKRAMQKIWKAREKQIDLVIDNTSNMYGAIKGIAGNAIAPVRQLELTDDILEENL